eukprot:jgi/Psemu1/18656/gm1.18656_g
MKVSLRLLLTSLVATIPLCVAFSASEMQARRAQTIGPSVKGSSRLDAFRFGSTSAVDEQPTAMGHANTSFESDAFDSMPDACIATLCIGTCALTIQHAIDKIDKTLSAGATRVGGSVLLKLVILARPIALIMCATMVAAVVVVHLLNTGGEGFPLAVVPQNSYTYELLASMRVCTMAHLSAVGAGAH